VIADKRVIPQFHVTTDIRSIFTVNGIFHFSVDRLTAMERLRGIRLQAVSQRS
jgi:hypothetical protein